MLFSICEIDAMRLLRWCRFIPKEALFSAFPKGVIDLLLLYGFIKESTRYETFLLTKTGNSLLEDHIEGIPHFARSNYSEEVYLRKTRVSRFVVTAYRAGLKPFHTDTSSLKERDSCVLTSMSRRGGINPWGSTRIAALVRLGDMLCGVHYVAPAIGKISLVDELNLFNNNTAFLGNCRRAVIYTGESYESILAALSEREEDSDSRRTTYADAFGKFSMPVFIVPCDTVGAMQLSMMRIPDYRQRMVKIAFGNTGIVSPPPADHPEWDAMYQGRPLVMAADMDFLRIDAAVGSAAASPYKKAYLLCLEGQKELLRKKYKAKGMAESIIYILWDKPELKREVFLYAPPDRQFETAKGEVIHVPPIPKAHADSRKVKK